MTDIILLFTPQADSDLSDLEKNPSQQKH